MREERGSEEEGEKEELTNSGKCTYIKCVKGRRSHKMT